MSLLTDIYTLPLAYFFPNAPGVPIVVSQVPDTLLRLANRAQQSLPAKLGLTTRYTIGPYKDAAGYQILFGAASRASALADEQVRLAQRMTPLLATQALYQATNVPVLNPASLAAALSAAPPDAPAAARSAAAPADSLSDALGAAPLDLLTAAVGVAPLAAQVAAAGPPAGLADRAPGAHLLAAAPGPRATLATRPGVPLDKPEQFSISWTTFDNIYQQASHQPTAPNQQSVLAHYASTLTDADAATAAFWPQLAGEAGAFNLLVVKKISLVDDRFKDAVSSPELEALATQGLLYAIDLSLFGSLKPQVIDGCPRFTPATYTLLTQDPSTKALTPTSISILDPNSTDVRQYKRATATPSAWLYALQAVKTSLTVYGIWLGHVYHWHLPTAAMQMTMFNTFQRNVTHPVYELLAPQSEFLMAFDNVLLAFWDTLAPPTSISSAAEFLTFIDQFAEKRSFFDDDPHATLQALNLSADDFTRGPEAAWEQYPVVQQLLAVWEASQQYVTRVVAASYHDDDDKVKADTLLQDWMDAAGPYPAFSLADPLKRYLSVLCGNLRGLPAMDSVANLTKVLTSIVYRTTVHGLGRLVPMANPSLTFVANFPPCLQSTTLPAPTDTLSTAQLLAYLPNTGTIGEMVNFYYTFSFSVPYKPLIPVGGTKADLYFPEPKQGPRNQALIQFRKDIRQVITKYYPYSYSPYSPDQTNQWPLNIET